MKMLVLAGGFGTRLQSIVSDVPKALAPVDSIPFLQMQIENWVNNGFREFIFLLHHKSDQIIQFIREARRNFPSDCELEWEVEPRPLGTGGAIAHAVGRRRIKDDFLITNADTWLDSGYRLVAEASEPTIAIVHQRDASRYGQVKLSQNVVVEFLEKSTNRTPGWINAGLCHLSGRHFTERVGEVYSLEHDLFPELVRKRELRAIKIESNFIDIGVPDDYRKFCQMKNAL